MACQTGLLRMSPVEVGVHVIELTLKPAHVLLDALLDSRQREAEPILLGGDHVDDLAPAPYDRVERTGILVGQDPDLGPYAFAEEREHVGVDCIGLGELAGRPGEVTYLPRVRDHDRDLSGCEGRGCGNLEPSCGLHHHECRPDLMEALK